MPKTNKARKYEFLVKFLSETMTDERRSHRIRMQAAAKLDAIYLRLDKETDEMRRRREKKAAERDQDSWTEASLLAAATPVPEDPEEVEEARIQDVFANILKKQDTGETHEQHD